MNKISQEIRFIISKQRTYIIFVFLVSISLTLLYFGNKIVNAGTQVFTQSDWSGGEDGGATINESNLTGWTKYSSKSSAILTNNEDLTLEIFIQQN